MFLFITCQNAKFTGTASNRFYRPVIQFILNDTGFHILNDTMAALFIKSVNHFTVFYADRNAYFIAITPWIFHANYRVNRNMIKVCDFSQDTFYLVLFHFQLHCVAHMLQLATATFIKHIARRFHAFWTWFLYFK